MRDIIRGSFFQLLVLYYALIFAAAAALMPKYVLHFELFGVLLGLMGAYVYSQRQPTVVPRALMWLPILLSLSIVGASRAWPLLGNPLPLGYDPGIYKNVFEQFGGALPLASWAGKWAEPGYFAAWLYLSASGLDASLLLNGLPLLFELLLALACFVAVRRLAGPFAGAAATLFFALSTVQFKAYGLYYAKNIFAMSLLLLSLGALQEGRFKRLAVFGGFLGAVHRPTFVPLAFAFLAQAARKLLAREGRAVRGLLLAAAAIVALVLVSYHQFFVSAILEVGGDALAQAGGGTFLDFMAYQFSILVYLPFAALAFALLAREKKFMPLFTAAFGLAVVVVLQLAFFRRFLIQLDILVIALAGMGAARFWEMTERKWIAAAVLGLALLSGAFLLTQEVQHTPRYLSPEELEGLRFLAENAEPNATVMSLASVYSPWVLGYSGRKAVLPGLFESDRWSKSQWGAFWASGSPEKAAEMLHAYDKPLYLFIGGRETFDTQKFRGPCFSEAFRRNQTRVVKVAC